VRYRQGRELDRRERAWLATLTADELAYADVTGWQPNRDRR
jgi:hypothetical protein